MGAFEGHKPGVRARIPKLDHPIMNDDPIGFSFKYLDLDSTEKFRVGACEIEFLRAVLAEIKRLSSLTVAQFCEYDPSRHSHHIIFEDTTEPEGFPGLDEQLEPEFSWQFAIQPNRPWRVHGFFVDSTFYIVWLDPEHRLDGSKKSA